MNLFHNNNCIYRRAFWARQTTISLLNDLAPLLKHHQDLKSIQFNTFYSNKCSFISNYRLSIFCIHVSLYYTTVYCFVNYSYCKPSLQMMLYNIIYLHFWRFKLDFLIGVQNLKTIKSHFTLIPNFLVYILRSLAYSQCTNLICGVRFVEIFLF